MDSLDQALRQLEAAEANVKRLEDLAEEIKQMMIARDGRLYSDRCRAFRNVLGGLPPIEGWQPADRLGESEMPASRDGRIAAQTGELKEYRFRLNEMRLTLVRNVVLQLMRDVDAALLDAAPHAEGKPDNASMPSTVWQPIKDRVSQIDTLLGSSVPRPSSWRDLGRHLSFGKVDDFNGIAKRDWPAAKKSFESSLYSPHEPLPVAVSDLGDLRNTIPTAPVPRKLKWTVLSGEEFERLVYAIVSTADGYENPAWLTRTTAADQGRDISVDRVLADSLGGTRRERVFIQCKHWQTKSVSGRDVTVVRDQMVHWDNPRVDSLIIATSGRFTAGAIKLIEKHNAGNNALRIEMWPDSHFELLLAERPALIAEFKLR
jgi:hypothetical protein